MKIESITLETPDLTHQKQFYQDILELPCQSESHALTVQIGTSKLVFQEKQVDINGHYHFAINIHPNMLQESKEFLTKKGINLIQDNDKQDEFRFESWNANSIYFFDAAGNILEFICRHNLKSVSPKKKSFDISDIQCISEIGVVTNQLEAVKSKLENAGVVAYGNPSESFAAMGDETGLIILVEEKREWYPNTGILAKSLPSEVVFSTNHGKRFSMSHHPQTKLIELN